MVTDDGTEYSFRRPFIEVEPTCRTVPTWASDGWTGVEAVESKDLHEAERTTKQMWHLTFRDQVGRDHMDRADGPEANLEIPGRRRPIGRERDRQCAAADRCAIHPATWRTIPDPGRLDWHSLDR